MQKKEKMGKRHKSDENLRKCEVGRAGYFDDDEDIRYLTRSRDFRQTGSDQGVLQDQVMEKVQRGAEQPPNEEQFMKNVTFDDSTDEGSEYDSETEYDFISAAPSRLPSLLQQLSVELRAVLAALPTLSTLPGYIYQPSGVNPANVPMRVHQNPLLTEPGVPISTFVSNPNLSTTSQSLTNLLGGRWSHYFPAGLPPIASGDVGGLASSLGFIPASPSTTQPTRSPHGYMELRLDESNQIRVYHH
uniref:Uncharacterized protein n=1 Tax=Eptatretus burgeri TaxID=7764 RepID=A0A8C4QRU4_EPTBU